jgi:O-antigen/teichoic acid export membrane protein
MNGAPAATSSATLSEGCHGLHTAARRRLERRIQLAWAASVVSKVGTFATQLIAVPEVYRTLGQEGYAAYAAVTSTVSILGALNLGIGSSLVTPLARASAVGDRTKEASLFIAGLLPLASICIVALALAIPVGLMIPLPVLLGEAARTNVCGLREALLLACAVTLVSLPFTLVDSLRQAYQELHVTYLIGSVANAALCGGLLSAAHARAGLPVFVALLTGVPLAATLLNGWLLAARRPYLFNAWSGYHIRQSLELASDGFRYLAAGFSYLLVYQWPVYLMARSRPAAESATFAVSVQMVLLPLSFLAGAVQPFWGTAAEATARGDEEWVRVQLRRSRRAAVAAGLVLGVSMAIWGEQVANVWLGKRVELGRDLRIWAGVYLLLAIWEYLHFVFALGVGKLREGATMAFTRSAGFALFAPVLVSLWGGTGAWLGLCVSIAIYTAWRLPRLTKTSLGS